MIQKKSSAPTMKDVAREAGVALGTVSRVINGKPVTEEYQRRVMEAIETLNYHVNSYAQGLKTTRTYIVAVLIPNTINPFYGMLLEELQRSLALRGYRTLLCCTEHNPRMEQEFLDLARNHKVDGLIGLTYSHDLVIEPDLPFISIDRAFHATVPCVASDNYAGGVLAAETLGALGCKKVLFLRTGSSLENEPNKRRIGFESACQAMGLPYEIMLLGDEPDFRNRFKAFLDERIIDGKASFDGIFCTTDALAFHIRDLLSQLNQRVPEDVQIIGYDGVCYLNTSFPVCSSIVQPVSEIAEAAVDLLLGDKSYSKPPLICLPVTFREGGTTKPLQGR